MTLFSLAHLLFSVSLNWYFLHNDLDLPRPARSRFLFLRLETRAVTSGRDRIWAAVFLSAGFRTNKEERMEGMVIPKSLNPKDICYEITVNETDINSQTRDHWP